jgi:hypothetical protein
MKPFVELGFMPRRAGQRFQNHFLVARQRDTAQRPEQMGGLHPRFRPPRAGTLRRRRGAHMVFRSLERTEPGRTFLPARNNSISISTPRRPVPSRAFPPITKWAARRRRVCGWVPEFIHFCDTNHAPVDFISTHTYGVESGFLDEHGDRGTVLSQNPNSIIGDVKQVRQQIADSRCPSWNSTSPNGVRPTRRPIRFTTAITARPTFWTSSRNAATPRNPCPTGRSRTFSRKPARAGRPFTAASA